jgi:hypothetical protein
MSAPLLSGEGLEEVSSVLLLHAATACIVAKVVLRALKPCNDPYETHEHICLSWSPRMRALLRRNLMQLSFARLLSCGMVALVVGTLLSTAGATSHAFAQEPGIVNSKYDRTHNLVVNSSDVSDLLSNWLMGSQSDQCTLLSPDDDLNGDGCLDVADIQQLAANTGTVTTLHAPFLHVAPNATAATATFTVNTNRAGKPDSSDIKDTNPGDGSCRTSNGDCTLQAAVQEANVRVGPERIVFSNSLCAGGVVIQPGTNTENWLQIDDARLTEGVTIDGYANGCGSPNTDSKGSNAVIRVELSGAVEPDAAQSKDGVNGIEIKTANNVIKGIALYSWDRQIEMTNAPATHNHIEGNIIGSNASLSLGQVKGPTNHREGVRIEFGGSHNIIGCGTYNGDTYAPCTTKSQINAARNIISGNGNDGIHLEGTSVVDNHIVGNLIGVKGDGETRLSNQADAVDFENGVQNNWLGGETAGERNVISGNGSEGIEISHTTTTQYNKVAGNYFGLNASGNRAIRNCGNGISVEDTPNYNAIYNNVIAGNYGSGVRIYRRSTHNDIYGNKIGLGANNANIPNGQSDSTCEQADYGKNGVLITGGGQYTNIHDNIIANHAEHGVNVSVNTIEEGDIQLYGDALETDFNTISHNSIYNNALQGIRLKTATNSKTKVTYTGNQGLNAPQLESANTSLVFGRACTNCKIEVFIADANGQGKTFVGSATVGVGNTFAVPVSNVNVGQSLTSTATDAQGNTSEFSAPIVVANANVGATATAVAATPIAQMTSTAAVQATNTAQAQTATAIAIATQPSLGGTATAIAVTQTAAAAPPGTCTGAHCISLPLVQR